MVLSLLENCRNVLFVPVNIMNPKYDYYIQRLSKKSYFIDFLFHLVKSLYISCYKFYFIPWLNLKFDEIKIK